MKGTSFLAFTLLLIALTSCSRIYLPTTAIPSGIEEKGECNASISGSLAGGFANVSYSPFKHVLVHGEVAASVNNTITSQRATLSNFGYTASFGPGFYFPIGEDLMLEGQISYGRGRIYYGDVTTDSYYGFEGAKGSYSVWNGFVALDAAASNDYHVGVLLRYHNVDIQYGQTNYPITTGSQHIIRHYGTYVYVKHRPERRINWFAMLGIEPFKRDRDYNDDYYEHKNPFFRVGIDIKLR